MNSESLTAKSPPEDHFNMEQFFQVSADLLCIAGADGYFKKINPIVCRTLGYTEDELLSRPINTFVYPPDRKITSAHRANLRNNIPLLNFENRYVTKQGELIWLSWTAVPVENKPYFFAIAKNITHKKELEEDRNRLLTKFSAQNKELKQLAYTTAHDFRTPVNNLVTGFGMIDTSKIEDPELGGLLQALKLSSEKLKDSLDLALELLIHKENASIALEEISLTGAFNEVITQLSSIIGDTQTTIHADFSRADKIKFNGTYLRSIFLNLVTNSIKYAKPNSYPVITVKSKKTNDMTVLIFSDEGQGFDMAKVKDRVFGFKQNFHKNGDSKGIGLYLIYNHLDSLGGKIKLKSNPDNGAQFIISFKQ